MCTKCPNIVSSLALQYCVEKLAQYLLGVSTCSGSLQVYIPTHATANDTIKWSILEHAVYK